jgi:hypothetical protein
MWQRYGIICHRGASTYEHVIEVIARNIYEACERCREEGFIPVVGGCLTYIRPVN